MFDFFCFFSSVMACTWQQKAMQLSTEKSWEFSEMPIYKLKKCPMISLVIPRSLEEMSRKFSSDGAKAITSIIRHSFTLITISTYPLHHLETMFLFEVLLPKIIALRYKMMYAASMILYLYLRCLLAFSSECFSSKITIGCWPQSTAEVFVWRDASATRLLHQGIRTLIVIHSFVVSSSSYEVVSLGCHGWFL